MPALELEEETAEEVEVPPVEKAAAEEGKGDSVLAQAAKATIGIIYPPPEVRNIVDKTASFVARNGPEFETRIRQNELNNPKFNFLAPSDPYNAYYRHKVREFFEGRGQEPSGAPKSGFGFMQQKPAGSTDQIAKIVEQVVPKEPPPEFEFIADPPSISAFDLDVVKLTAQFTARNGRQFLTNVMTRESRNYQFDFLRPQHSLFAYFTKLVEQYTKILIPPKDLLSKMRAEAENQKLILDHAKYRVEWARFQDRERKREEDERERERVAYAQIDWHDFVVVETVDYQPGESGNLPPPTTPDEVGARVLAQERFELAPATTDDDIRTGEPIGADDEEESSSSEEDEPPISDDDDEAGGEGDEGERGTPSDAARVAGAANKGGGPTPGADTNVQDMEQDSDPDEPDEEDLLAASRRPDPPHGAPAPPLPPSAMARDTSKPPPLPPNPDQVIIRRDYNPKAKGAEPTSAVDKFLISPITGEKISADKIQEHMRIGLLDPKWIEQRDRQIAERRDQEEVYAPGSAIGSSLKHLAERRTDIFGSGAEETQIGKKIGEEEKKDKAPKVTWDGHSGSMEKVAQRARENISIEDQIAVIHKVQGLLPDEDKEKIGPAMPRKFPAGIAPPPLRPSQPPMPPVTAPAAARPPLPSPAPPPRPPMPMRSMVPGPPRPPLPMGGMGVVLPPGGMVLPPQQMMGLRPPMPPMLPGGPLMGGPPPPPMMGAPPPPMGGHQSFMPMMQSAPPPPPPMRPTMARPPPSGGDDDEPGAKRAKTEEQLVPEQHFLAQHQGPVTFRVQVPSVTEKSEWNLSGQTFSVTLSLTDSVSVIKAKVFDVTGMQAGKQKLQLDGMFLKDSNTLAYYNLTPMSIVQLQLKERGGRKK